jgi:hypothetical protein
MTAVSSAFKMLAGHVDGVDRYFKTRITTIIDPKLTDLLITADPGSYTIFGSNEPVIEQQAVQVQVFVGKNNKTANLETIKEQIVSFFVSHRWLITFGPDLTTDPDTDATTLTLKFSRTIERKIN